MDRFKGFVPEEKLKMIEWFSLNDHDLEEEKLQAKGNRYSSLEDLSISGVTYSIKRFLLKYPNACFDSSVSVDSCLRVMYKVGETDYYFYAESINKIDNRSLLICAPKNDMELSGLEQIGNFFMSATKKTYPDPVVLQPCKGGYLIICAWGDEASDEMVVNPKDN